MEGALLVERNHGARVSLDGIAKSAMVRLWLARRFVFVHEVAVVARQEVRTDCVLAPLGSG